MSKLEAGDLTGVSETLLVPLHYRAAASRSGSSLFKDDVAERFHDEIAYDWEKFEGHGLQNLGIESRTRILDREVGAFVDANPEACVVNLGAGSAVDVYTSPAGGTSTLPATTFAAALAQYSASPWRTATPGALTLRANNAGSTTLPAMVDAAAPVGEAANRTLNLSAIGGSTIAGSAFTAFLFPSATVGSLAANVVAGTCPTRCTTPGAVYAVDRYPPSGF